MHKKKVLLISLIVNKSKPFEFLINIDQQLNEKIHSQHSTRRALHEFWLSRGSIPIPEMALQRFVDGGN